MIYTILIFAVCTFINVILSTVRSLFTVKGGTLGAVLSNMICYGFYTVVIVLTASGAIELWVKVVITVLANGFGVWIVKTIENKMRKDKLWEIRLTVSATNARAMREALTASGISHNFLVTDKWRIFNCYCNTQAETTEVVRIGKAYGAKMFASETKLMF